MNALAVIPRKKDSLRLINIQKPKVTQVPNGRGVLIKTLCVGLDGTDKEIIDGEYGYASEGEEYLIIGHESYGVVEAVGETVASVLPGDFITATVRRPGKSIYDKIGMPDFTTDDIYFERGINLLHGYLTEYYFES